MPASVMQQGPGGQDGEPLASAPAAIQPSTTTPALPSASRDPSGLLQNGFDQNAVTRFWGDNAVGGAPASGFPARVAQAQSTSDQQSGATSMQGASAQHAAPAMQGGLAPLYNPMADPAVRSSLHLARGGAAVPDHVRAALALRQHFDDGGDAGGGDRGSSGNDGSGEGGGGGDGNGGAHGDASQGSSAPSGGQSDAATGPMARMPRLGQVA